ncbi:UNVERIFIED_CONTAM: hypothetical protein FKN15_037663 [Acipenser sinensis]
MKTNATADTSCHTKYRRREEGSQGVSFNNITGEWLPDPHNSLCKRSASYFLLNLRVYISSDRC